jgi:hypothetical protein
MSTSPETQRSPASPSKAKVPLLALPGQLSDQLRGSLKTLQTNIGDSIEKGKLPGGIEIKCVPARSLCVGRLLMQCRD